MEKRIHIKLPQKIDNVLVTVAFAYGSLDESDSIHGLGHLVEHCVCRKIGEALDLKDVHGYIDQYATVFNASISKAGFQQLVSDGKLSEEMRKTSLELTQSEFENERNRLLVELDEQCDTTFSRFSEFVRMSVISSPASLSRARLSQRSNVENLTLEDYRSGVETLFASRCAVFAGDNAMTPVTYKKSKAFAETSEVTFSQTRTFHFPERGLAFAFRGLDFKAPLRERFAAGFLAGEIDSAFEALAQKHGSYQTYYQYETKKNYGLIWFGMHSYSVLDARVEDAFFGIIEGILQSRDISRKLALFKKSKRDEVRADWRDNVERQEWVIDDYIDYGKVLTPEYMAREIGKIDSALLRDVCRRIFARERAYVFKAKKA